MEILPSEEQPAAHGENAGVPKGRPSTAKVPPKQCRGRCHVQLADGQFQEITFQADVLHVCSGYLDVALLLARPTSKSSPGEMNGNRQLQVFTPSIWQCQAKGEPQEGTEVWAVGYGLFGPGSPWSGATLTRGHLSKTARAGLGARPAVLQSSAAVHRGCSGGALVDACSGEFLGMVTTNVKQQDGGVMPHVNFSLPASHMAPLHRFLEEPSKQGAIEILADEWLSYAATAKEQGLWRLEPESLDLPSRMAARKRQALARMQQLQEEAEEAEKAGSPPRSSL